MTLSKLPQKNAQVTVVVRASTGRVVAFEAHVRHTGRDISVVYSENGYKLVGVPDGSGGTRWDTRLTEERFRRTYTVRRRDEGITWAKGWTGEGPDALRAIVALGGESRARPDYFIGSTS